MRRRVHRLLRLHGAAMRHRRGCQGCMVQRCDTALRFDRATYEPTAVAMMAKACAKPRRMLSAYLMATATTSPPAACHTTVPHASGPKLCSQPCVASVSSFCTEASDAAAMSAEYAASWMLRSHREGLLAPLSIRSKYTEANDVSTAAKRKAPMPTIGSCGGHGIASSHRIAWHARDP